MLVVMAYSLSHVIDYFLKHIQKEPYIASYMIGEEWMEELWYGYEQCCFNMFRMNQCTFLQLCMDSESKYAFHPQIGCKFCRKQACLHMFLVKVH